MSVEESEGWTRKEQDDGSVHFVKEGEGQVRFNLRTRYFGIQGPRGPGWDRWRLIRHEEDG